MKQKIPEDIRLEVFERDNYTCRYCGVEVERPHCDHVFPETLGGPAVMGNLVTSCPACNRAKGSRLGIYPQPRLYFRRLVQFHEIKKVFDAMPDRQTDLLGHIAQVASLILVAIVASAALKVGQDALGLLLVIGFGTVMGMCISRARMGRQKKILQRVVSDMGEVHG